MSKLMIEHLAPYLPYGLEVKGYPYSGLPDEERQQHPVLGKMMGLDTSNAIVWFKDANGYYWDTTKKVTLFCFKPILRPLSQLTQEIEHNGERFVPYMKLGWESGYMLISCVKSKTKMDLPYRDAVKLFEWLFDVFGLIDAGLGIERGAES